MKRFICLALFVGALAFGQDPAKTIDPAVVTKTEPAAAGCSVQLANLQVHAAELQQQVDELKVQLQVASDPGVMRQRLHNLDALDLAKAAAKSTAAQPAAAAKPDTSK